MIKHHNNQVRDLINDDLFYIVNLDFFKKDLSKVRNIKNDILKIKKRIWY